MTDPAPTDLTAGGQQAPFRDAEAFLAELGVERRPIVVRLDQPDDRPDDRTDDRPGVASDPAHHVDARADAGHVDRSTDDDTPTGPPEVSVVEATRLVSETVPPDQVEAALAYVRRSTGAQPASEGRLRARLADRGHGPDVVDAVMVHARAERLVDDDALSAALVAEWRARGHAARRIRRDLRRRGFDESVVGRALGALDGQDEAAAAFELARSRAESLSHVPAETAFRRVVGYLARRGYGEGIARKAARDAVYDQRHDDRVAGH